MTNPTPLLPRLAPLAVRLPALWVWIVSTIKMVGGSPNDIPQVIRENGLLSPEITFFVTISIELSFALVALVQPRLGWFLMSALSAVFVAVLLHLIWIGATSCGCFGGAITLSPYWMLAIDGSLCAFMLATRPWKLAPVARAEWPSIVAVAAAGVVAPWVAIDVEPVVVTPPKPVQHVQAPPSETGKAPPTSKSDPVRSATPDKAPPVARPNTEQGNLTPRARSAEDWQLPTKLPRWARLRPSEWVGKSIHETDLAIWMNTRLQPEDATWILYRETCTHCAELLLRRTNDFASDPKIYVFVNLEEPKTEAERAVSSKPPGERIDLPPGVEWLVGPEVVPWELTLEAGQITRAVFHDPQPDGSDRTRTWEIQNGVAVETP